MKIKKVISLALALAIVGGTAPAAYSYPHFYASAKTDDSGTTEYAAVTEGNLIYNVYDDHAELAGCTEDFAGELKVPSKINKIPVTAIAEEAFNENSAITSVVIPDSVTKISNGAFKFCSELTSVKLPDTITEMGKEIFVNCYKLESVNIPTSITKIPELMFSGSGISSVTIPDNITVIGRSSFERCKNLKEIELPDTITFLDAFSFAYSGLTTFTVPSSVKTIESYAFSGCYDLAAFNYSDSVSYAGQNIIRGTEWLKNKQAEDPIVMINGLVIDGTACTGDVVIPDNATIVCGIAFRENKEMTSVVIPESVKTIDYNSFAKCGALESVTFKNPDCVIYPSDLTITNYHDEEKDMDSFSGTIYGYADSTAQEYAENYGYKFVALDGKASTTSKTTTTVTTTADTTTTTTTDTKEPAPNGNCGADLTWELKDGVLTISGTGDMDDFVYGSPFNGLDYSEVVIPDGVTRIGVNAFANSDLISIDTPNSLTSVDIPDSVTSIGDWAFYGCSKLTEITIPESVTEIGKEVFKNCPELTIKGAAGSYAETYAKKNKIPFEAISGTSETGTTTTTTTTTTTNNTTTKKTEKTTTTTTTTACNETSTTSTTTTTADKDTTTTSETTAKETFEMVMDERLLGTWEAVKTIDPETGKEDKINKDEYIYTFTFTDDFKCEVLYKDVAEDISMTTDCKWTASEEATGSKDKVLVIDLEANEATIMTLADDMLTFTMGNSTPKVNICLKKVDGTTTTTATTEDTTTTTTTTTTTAEYDHRPVIEYDDSPMKIGETRTVKVYGADKTVKGKIRSMDFNPDYITCDYKEGDDSFTITAVAAVKHTDIWVYESSCAFSGDVGITILDEQYVSTETTTTTTTTIPDDSTTTTTTSTWNGEDERWTHAEYDHSPLKIGETRPVYFYSTRPASFYSNRDYEYAGLKTITSKSDCITYSYNEGEEVLYITAVAPGKAELVIKQENTIEVDVVTLTVIDEQYEPETDKVEIDSDTRKRARLTDFNNNDHPDTEDAYTILNYYAGKELTEETSKLVKEYGDVDGNGVIDSLDASLLLAFLKDTRHPGDVNEDGMITATDASFVLSYVADISDEAASQSKDTESAGRKCFTYGDMNGDGKITSADASLILVKYAEMSA